MKKLSVLFTILATLNLSSQQLNESNFKDFMAARYIDANTIKYKNLDTLKVPFTILDYNDINYVPALVNGVYDYFVFDTGCSYGLAINDTLFEKILKSGEVFEEDFIGSDIIQTAVGNFEIIKVFIIEKVVVGKSRN